MKDREIYQKLEKVFDIVDNILPHEVIEAYGEEEGRPIDDEIALLHHLLDGLLYRIEERGLDD